MTTMRVVPPAGGFGVAEISGLEAGVASADEQERARDLVARYGMVCIRQSRPLDETELRATVEWFGPGVATVLHARELPPSGGGPTCFSDMRAALELLPKELRGRIEHLDVVYAYDNEDAFFPPRRRSKGPSSALVDVVHPLVRMHHLAGTKSLFVDLDRAKHVVDIPVEEGRALLRELQARAEKHAPKCEHDWHDHDVLVWDNVSVQHRASGNFRLGEPRRFWRHLVGGPPPSREGPR